MPVIIAMPYIYLCGPIQGRSDSECIEWRQTAAKLLSPISVLDPIRRDYREKDYLVHAKTIVEGDLEDIYKSSCLLVMFDIPSVGTSMEIYFAYTINKPVFVVDVSNKIRSPWLLYHTTRFFDNLNQACDHIRQEYGELE